MIYSAMLESDLEVLVPGILSKSNRLLESQFHATGKTGSRFSTTTDERGVYSFSSLPSGAYRVEEDLPAGFSRPDERETGAFNVHVLHRSRAGAQCRVSAFPKPDGEISGKVVDSNGKGLPGFITLQPSDPEEVQWASTHGGLPAEETDDGAFSLPLLPPGKYRLVFNPALKGNEIFIGRVAATHLHRTGLSLKSDSILRFIEENWKLGQIGNGSTDIIAGRLDAFFDFEQQAPRF